MSILNNNKLYSNIEITNTPNRKDKSNSITSLFTKTRN
jgi:hypothetical protein